MIFGPRTMLLVRKSLHNKNIFVDIVHCCYTDAGHSNTDPDPGAVVDGRGHI